MQKKNFMNNLRVLMAVGSIVGFVGGWTLLAESGTQVVSESRTSTTAMVESAPTQTTALVTSTPTAASAAQVQPANTPTPTPTATVKLTTTIKTAKSPSLRTGGS